MHAWAVEQGGALLWVGKVQLVHAAHACWWGSHLLLCVLRVAVVHQEGTENTMARCCFKGRLWWRPRLRRVGTLQVVGGGQQEWACGDEARGWRLCALGGVGGL